MGYPEGSIDDLTSYPKLKDFFARRAHVVHCVNGGYGVMQFGGLGVVRHGYDYGLSVGRFTYAQAKSAVDSLNDAAGVV